jgi:hypothetical protein
VSAWTPERDATLRACAESGDSFEAAGAVLGVTRNAVAGRARRLTVRFHGGGRRWTDQQTATLTGLLQEERLTLAQCARRMGVPVGTISAYYHRLGLRSYWAPHHSKPRRAREDAPA